MNILDIMTVVDPISAALLFWFAIFSRQFESWPRFARIGFAIASGGLMYQGWALFMGFDRPGMPSSTFWYFKDLGLATIGITFSVLWAKEQFKLKPVAKKQAVTRKAVVKKTTTRIKK
jgi:hypothetical protein